MAENSDIRLIVGLGNIGKEYEDTRHNAGFWFVDALADQYSGRFSQNKKFSGETATVRIDGKDVLLLKPSTLMNRSGIAVAAVCNFYKILPANTLIVHDELDLLPGTVKLKKGGGSGGHNGLKSIIQMIGTPDFYRLRIGIGHPRDFNLHMDVADFVLSKPRESSLEEIQKSILHALKAVPDLVDGEIAKATKLINTAAPLKKEE